MPTTILSSNISSVFNALDSINFSLDYETQLNDYGNIGGQTATQISARLVTLVKSGFSVNPTTGFFEIATFTTRFSGNGIGPVGSLSGLIAAIDSGVATGGINRVVIDRNGLVIADFAISTAGYTFTTGGQSLAITGALPATFSQLFNIGNLLDQLAQVDFLSSSARNALFNNLSVLDIDSLTLTDGGQTVLGLDFSATSVSLTLEGYVFTLQGSFPTDIGKALSVLWDVAALLDSGQNFDPALVSGLDVTSFTLKAPDGSQLLSVTHLFDGTPDADIVDGIRVDEIVPGTNGESFVWTGSGFQLQGDSLNGNAFAPIREAFLGFGGRDVINGFAGADLIYGGDDGDTLFGGLGNDQISGDAGGDRLDGGTGNDRILGGDGNDVLIGSLGNDTLLGGTGNDTLNGSGGNDLLDGGTDARFNRDTLVFTGRLDVRVNLGVTTAQDTGYGLDTIINVEDVTGGSGRDGITGNGSANRLLGGVGDDVLFGKGGIDTLAGEWGDDKLFGGSEIDYLYGGGGDDSLTGGTEGDMFVFFNASNGNLGRDHVTDFVLGEDSLDFGSLVGNLIDPSLGARGVVIRYADVVNGSVVFDFGGNDKLTLDGLGTTTGLWQALILF